MSKLRIINTLNNNVSQCKILLDKELILPYDKCGKLATIYFINKNLNIFQIYLFNNNLQNFKELLNVNEYIKIVHIYKKNITKDLQEYFPHYNMIKNSILMIYINNELKKMVTGNIYKFDFKINNNYNPEHNKRVFVNNNEIDFNNFTNGYINYYKKFKTKKYLTKLHKIKLINFLKIIKNKQEIKNKEKIKNKEIYELNKQKNKELLLKETDINIKKDLLEIDFNYFKNDKINEFTNKLNYEIINNQIEYNKQLENYIKLIKLKNEENKEKEIINKKGKKISEQIQNKFNETLLIKINNEFINYIKNQKLKSQKEYDLFIKNMYETNKDLFGTIFNKIILKIKTEQNNLLLKNKQLIKKHEEILKNKKEIIKYENKVNNYKKQIIIKNEETKIKEEKILQEKILKIKEKLLLQEKERIKIKEHIKEQELKYNEYMLNKLIENKKKIDLIKKEKLIEKTIQRENKIINNYNNYVQQINDQNNYNLYVSDILKKQQQENYKIKKQKILLLRKKRELKLKNKRKKQSSLSNII